MDLIDTATTPLYGACLVADGSRQDKAVRDMENLKSNDLWKQMLLAARHFGTASLGEIELAAYDILQFAELQKLGRVGAFRGFDEALESEDVQECDGTSGELDFIHYSRSPGIPPDVCCLWW